MRLQKKLTTAQLGNASLSASQIIAKAQASGAIVASEVPYFTALARQHGVAALNAQLVGRKPLAALSARQTKGLVTPPKSTVSIASLSAQERAVCAATGISEAKYLATKKAQMKG